MLNKNIIIKDFYEKGFVKISNLFSTNEINKVLKEINLIKEKFNKINNPNLHLTKDNKVNTIHDINKFINSNVLNKVSKNKKLINIVEYILDGQITARNFEFFLKPKNTGKPSPVHQDNFYWNIKNKKALNVWIACTNSSKKNGGVFYFEKSHNIGLIDHELSYAAGSSQKVPDKIVKSFSYKKSYPNLKPGDCIIHHCEVAHGSEKNSSKLDRIGLVISYKKKGARVDKNGWDRYQAQLKKNLKYVKNYS